MKKVGILIILFAVLLLFLTGFAVVTASENDITELTLDYVLQRALLDNSNLNILEYTWQMWRYQILDLNSQITELNQTNPVNAAYYPVARELFEAQIPNYDQLSEEEKLEIDQLIDTQILINLTLNLMLEAQYATENSLSTIRIAEQKKALYENISKLEANKKITKLQEAELEKGIKLMLTTQYAQILILEEELNYLDEELKFIDKEIKKTEVYKSLGLGSSENIWAKQEEYRIMDSKLNQLKLLYDQYLAELSLELNLPVNLQVQLKPLNIGIIEQPIIPSSYSALIFRQYQLLIAEENLIYAEHQLNKVGSGNANLKKQYEYNVKIAEAKVALLRDKLQLQIAELYYAWKQAYRDYVDALSSYEYQKEQEDSVLTKYQLGLIAKHDLDNYYLNEALLLKQLTLAKTNYFLAKEKVSYMLEGYLE